MTTANVYPKSQSPTILSEQPRSRRSALLTLRNIAIAYEILALIITGYLSYNKFTAQPLQCAASGVINCSVLESSAWSQVVFSPTFVVPVAFLGFLCHAFMLTVILSERRLKITHEWGNMILFGVALFGFLYHCYLTFYVAIATMRAICPYCLMAHTLMGGLLVIAFLRLRAGWNTPPMPAATA